MEEVGLGVRVLCTTRLQERMNSPLEKREVRLRATCVDSAARRCAAPERPQRARPLVQLKPRSASASEPRRGLSLSQQRVYPLIPRYRPASSLSLLYLALAPAADVLYLSSRMNG
jgi:hypothetical protein